MSVRAAHAASVRSRSSIHPETIACETSFKCRVCIRSHLVLWIATPADSIRVRSKGGREAVPGCPRVRRDDPYGRAPLVSDKRNVLFGAPAEGAGSARFGFRGLCGADDSFADNRLKRLIMDGVRGPGGEGGVGEPDCES
jgi:hypothetical protein